MAAKTEEPAETEFTAPVGIKFHDTDVHFTRDRASGPYSFTAPSAGVADQVRKLAAAEPQWGIKEVSD